MLKITQEINERDSLYYLVLISTFLLVPSISQYLLELNIREKKNYQLCTYVSRVEKDQWKLYLTCGSSDSKVSNGYVNNTYYSSTERSNVGCKNADASPYCSDVVTLGHFGTVDHKLLRAQLSNPFCGLGVSLWLMSQFNMNSELASVTKIKNILFILLVYK